MVQLSLFSKKQPSGSKSKLPEFDLASFRDKTYLTHNFHPYPAKYVPQIPRLIIEALSNTNDVILDPFCGSGTTLVEGRILGRKCFGSDSHPLAVIMSQAKTMSLETDELSVLREFQERIQLALVRRKRSGDLMQLDPLPEFVNRDKWFKSIALEELNFIKSNISRIDNQKIKIYLSTCLSSIVVKTSNQESDTRWRAIDRPIILGQTLGIFLNHLDNMISRSKHFSSIALSHPTVEICQSDARSLTYLTDGQIDLLVTSPPYMNSFDYYLYHKLRLFLLDFDPKIVQEMEIGSRNKHSDLQHGEDDFRQTMHHCLTEFNRVLKPMGNICLVIGDSVLNGTLIRMDLLYESILRECGFQLLDIFSYDQREYTKAFTKNWKTQNKQSHIILARKEQ